MTRGYVKREGKNLLPTPLGEVTNRVMKENFPSIVDYAFTADMETRLDEIEQGTENLENLLSGFYQDFALSLQQAQEKIDKEDVEIPPDVSPYTCDLCGNPLIYKVGRFGKFLACSNYPACHNTKTIDKDGNPVEKEKKAPEKADFACPQCGGDVVLRHGKFGVFYACVNYPKCTFTKQKVDRISILCPDCQSPIVIKRGKNRFAFYSCERYPECQFSTWDIPTEEKCPDCGDMLLRRKGKKVLYCRNKECGYKADEKETTEEA